LGIYFPLASFGAGWSFPLGFSYYLSLANDFEFASFLFSYFLPPTGSFIAYFYDLTSFLSGALLSFLLSFS
jgi:hypothetical protein